MERIELLLPLLGKPGESVPPSMREAMRELHFDLAGAPVPQLLPALLSVADIKHIHYGSDYPFTPEDTCSLLAERIASTPILTSADQALIWRDNALVLFPRFAKRNTSRGARPADSLQHLLTGLLNHRGRAPYTRYASDLVVPPQLFQEMGSPARICGDAKQAHQGRPYQVLRLWIVVDDERSSGASVSMEPGGDGHHMAKRLLVLR